MRWLSVLGMLAMVACSDAVAPNLAAYAGTYTLRSINDASLPYVVIQQTDLKLEITADTIAMAPGGSFSDITHYRRTRSAVLDYPADSLAGSWTIRGQTITFTAQTGVVFSGTIFPSSFSIVGNATTSIFAK